MDYAVNRIYSSEQGRFLQPDPIGMASVDLTDPQSLNMYTYARNDPVGNTDRLGLDDTLANAIKLVRRLIKGRSCASLFSKYTGKGKRRRLVKKDPTKLLDRVLRKKHLQVKSDKYPSPDFFINGKPQKIKMKPFKNRAAVVVYEIGGPYRRIYINRKGSFFTGDDYFRHKEGLSLAEYQAIVIIHELLHYMNADGNYWFTDKDWDNPYVSMTNSLIVKIYCLNNSKRQKQQPESKVLPRFGGGGSSKSSQGNSSGSLGSRQDDPFRSLSWVLFMRWAKAPRYGPIP